ncbi:Prolyl aminopeptidase [Cupriavidus taiwanensis]|uniref:Proline iminopeptidase n=1 Tax=Cupriavidus taiwanensis TaxID=164546 RepID=A0A375EFP9_9BURK|nr:alpha/beta fold hydrolase [Cupriavidus taiwanensis]SOZ62731.1 Prolyl aminopeptidase [Cupriavidus taiwanensis]SOZ62964.1 Prolyl aminopeptidase [Cupriavidus taiwanensis]SOZ74015.1 Prolyl aminopeptidase [Cupriavidus taiwanensis]SPA01121.1 Prolyl aminopeptidase [Cupriavidus taiwanensis]SPA11029.1 Prolyl aminopeptidase [Cupriavidus taiwanensis]
MPDATLNHTVFHLRTPDAQRLHVRLVGPARGEPWLVLHGGPGSGCAASMAAWFDPQRHRVVMPDQRGAGRSTPAGGLRRNNVGALLADLEQLRAALGIARWGVVGGSWGAALALAYAARYPHAVAALVLRGAFLTGRDDVLGLFAPRPGSGLLRRVAPAGERLPEGRARLLTVSRLLQSGTAVQKRDTATAWRRLELERLGLRGVAQGRRQPARERLATVRKYRIQAHYLRHRAGLGKPALLRAARGIAAHGLPVTLLHGRADAVCRPANALRLRQAMPDARLAWVEGGHLADGAMRGALAEAIRASAWLR